MPAIACQRTRARDRSFGPDNARREDEATAIRAEQRIFQCRRAKEFENLVEAQTDGGDRAIVDDDPVGAELF